MSFFSSVFLCLKMPYNHKHFSSSILSLNSFRVTFWRQLPPSGRWLTWRFPEISGRNSKSVSLPRKRSSFHFFPLFPRRNLAKKGYILLQSRNYYKRKEKQKKNEKKQLKNNEKRNHKKKTNKNIIRPKKCKKIIKSTFLLFDRQQRRESLHNFSDLPPLWVFTPFFHPPATSTHNAWSLEL